MFPYEQMLRQISDANCKWVQIDEPSLVTDLDPFAQEAFSNAYSILGNAAAALDLKILLTTYFGGIEHNIDLITSLPVSGIHVDLVSSSKPEEVLDLLIPKIKRKESKVVLSLGVINGRNVWKGDMTRLSRLVEKVAAEIGPEKVIVAPSCSLLHCPHSVEHEKEMDSEIRSWLVFAVEKLKEIVMLAKAVNLGGWASEGCMTMEGGIVADFINDNALCLLNKNRSERRHDPSVQERVKRINRQMTRRKGEAHRRFAEQRMEFDLPLFPTTMIGSLPQTKEVRNLAIFGVRSLYYNESSKSFAKENRMTKFRS